jgi:CYTH domain-containing protein
MTILVQKLSDYGYRTLVCPETATLIINAGVDVVALAASEDRSLELQRQIIRTQRALRSRFRELAALYDEPVVLLFDRGEMDNAAYIEPELFSALLEEEHLSLSEVRDSYDLIIHLVTAAEGAEHAYTTTNNAARSESPELARELDQKTLSAWVGHPRLRIIDNSTDFDTKMNRVLRAATQFLGQPAPLEIERKFLVGQEPDMEALEKKYSVRAVEIEQTYLVSSLPTVEIRVRRRTQGQQSAYYRTEKVTVSPGHRYERERTITGREYRQLLATRDPERHTIRKTRYCFPAEGLYFELDHIHAPRDLWILEVELTEDATEVCIPSEIVVAKEVTTDLAFKNAEIARGAGSPT